MNLLLFYQLKRELYEAEGEHGIGKKINERIAELEQELRETFGDDFDKFSERWKAKGKGINLEFWLPLATGVVVVTFVGVTVIRPAAKITGKTTAALYKAKKTLSRRDFLRGRWR